jgi:hypothetical protein
MKRQRHGPHRKLGSTRLIDATSSSWNAHLRVGTFGALLTERLCDATAALVTLPACNGRPYVSQSSLAIFPPDTTRTPLLIPSAFIIQYIQIYSHITGSLQRKCQCISVHLYRIPLTYQPPPYIYTCPPKILAILEHSRL